MQIKVTIILFKICNEGILQLYYGTMHHFEKYSAIPYYSNPFANMIFGPREKSCYSKIMLWKSATKNFYSVIISHYTRENFYSVIISHYTREKCNHKKFQCYISLLMYIHTDKIFVQCIRLQVKLTNY